MVKLNVVRSANAALAEATKSFVAVVAGGTAGIGEFTVRAIAATFATRGNGLRVYIVGRNEDAARKIISDCETLCPGGSFLFYKGDLSLIREVDRVCAEITRAEQGETETSHAPTKIDFLVCCQGILSTSHEETPEELDKYFCLFYYSRMRFIDRLLPLLTASPLAGHVVSVLNASVKSALILDDMSLRVPRNQGLLTAFAHLVGMTNIFMEEIARQNPGKISLSHYYPGNVPTNAASTGNFPWWLKTILTWVIIPLSRPFGVPFEECGQRVLFMASPIRFPALEATTTTMKRTDGVEVAKGMDGVIGSGAYRVTSDDDVYPQEKRYGELHEKSIVQKVFQHTMTVFAEIEAGRPFRG